MFTQFVKLQIGEKRSCVFHLKLAATSIPSISHTARSNIINAKWTKEFPSIQLCWLKWNLTGKNQRKFDGNDFASTKIEITYFMMNRMMLSSIAHHSWYESCLSSLSTIFNNVLLLLLLQKCCIQLWDKSSILWRCSLTFELIVEIGDWWAKAWLQLVCFDFAK